MTTLPEKMTVIAVKAPGGPDMLVREERPLPEFGPGEILVRVRAAGVNRPDVMQRKGQYPPPAGVTDILGLEIAGEVVAVGNHARRFKIGSAVTALVPGGGYAEFCKVDETNALPVPAGLSMVEAAAIPETFFTVWPNLFERGRLMAGETVLIHGGSSGIGTVAIQLAKAAGATVIVTAGSDRKCAACLRIGADTAINYRTEDFVARTREATGDRGADVILDMVGGDYVTRNYQAAAEDGRIVQIALQQGRRADVDLRLMMAKRLIHTGSTLRPRPVAFKAEVAETLRQKVWPLIEAGTVVPVIDSTFPLERAAEAHARMEASDHIGKMVLEIA